MALTKPQFIQAILDAQADISNTNPPLSQADAQSQFATAIGNAVDGYIQGVGDGTRIDSMKTQLLALVAEMQRQNITIGTNLNAAVLTNVLEGIGDV